MGKQLGGIGSTFGLGLLIGGIYLMSAGLYPLGNIAYVSGRDIFGRICV